MKVIIICVYDTFSKTKTIMLRKKLLTLACIAINLHQTNVYSLEYDSDAETVVEKFSIESIDPEHSTYEFLYQLHNQITQLHNKNEYLEPTPPYACPSCITNPLNLLRNACVMPLMQCIQQKCVVEVSYSCCEKSPCNIVKPYFDQAITSCCQATCTTLCAPVCKHVITADCVRCLCFTVGCYWLDAKKESK